MFADGTIDKAQRTRRLAEVDEAVSRLDSRRVLLAIPRVDWSWQPRNLNAALRAMFDAIELDPETFQPVGFAWVVPEWRAE